MTDLRHDRRADPWRGRLAHDGDQPVAGARLRDDQRPGGQAGQWDGDFKGPGFLVESHRRQLRNPVREEDAAEVDHLARRTDQREFGRPDSGHARIGRVQICFSPTARKPRCS